MKRNTGDRSAVTGRMPRPDRGLRNGLWQARIGTLRRSYLTTDFCNERSFTVLCRSLGMYPVPITDGADQSARIPTMERDGDRPRSCERSVGVV